MNTQYLWDKETINSPIISPTEPPRGIKTDLKNRQFERSGVKFSVRRRERNETYSSSYRDVSDIEGLGNWNSTELYFLFAIRLSKCFREVCFPYADQKKLTGTVACD